MNKTKRVAWRKHRIKEKKAHEKRRAQQKAAGTVATSTARR
ncbi:MAG TPA: hypothetical protein VFQ30_17505 [Ktedonobacteraceae bacterium]|nr:hypothetical protein [Ktedonobacteraceae bacterium]